MGKRKQTGHPVSCGILFTNTAQLKQSIWADVGRQNFERDLLTLHRTRFVPTSQTLRKEEWPKPRADEILPFPVEKQLADDVAFISAYDYGVQYVTAATVQSNEHGGLTVRLVANEGVSSQVGSALRYVFNVLENCSSKEITRDQCAEAILDIVVELNRNRILGRLASKHFKRPVHEKLREPLPLRLKHRVSLKRNQPAIELREFLRQIDALDASFHLVESTGGTLVALKAAVKDAFCLTGDGFSLFARLGRIGFRPSEIDVREIHEVNKLANYWRICVSLAHLSRSYRSRFSRLELDTLQPYEASFALGDSMKKFVHAEVQMLVFYETSQEMLSWPRAIGASKEACFLCNSLVKAHGCFYLSKAHCQIFPQWIVPDLKVYNIETLKKLQKVLVQVHRDITSALKQARQRQKAIPCPRQSSINLYKPSLPTPSTTTIRSQLEPTDIASAFDNLHLKQRSEPSGRSSPSTTLQRPSIPDAPFKSHADHSVCDPISTPRLQPIPSQPSSNLTLLEPISQDWLRFYISFESNHDRILDSIAKVSVNVEVISEALPLIPFKYHHFDVDDPAFREETVLPHITGSANETMNVVLTKRGRKPVLISCRW